MELMRQPGSKQIVVLGLNELYKHRAMEKINRITLEHWIHEVFKLNREYYELIQAGIEQELNPPAQENEISDFENQVGFSLPYSYRLFLSMHNGWQHFEGDKHLLSLHEQTSGKYFEWINGQKNRAWEEGNVTIMEGLFIGGQLNDVGGYIFNTSSTDERGEMEIVSLDYGIIARYSDFVDLLKKTAEDLQEIINEEPRLGDEN